MDAPGVLRYDVFWVNTLTSSETVTHRQRTHVAVTCEGANGEGPWDFTVGATLNMTFPQPSGSQGGYLTGDTDEVAVWSTALSVDQTMYEYDYATL
ncbi:MAG: hypothetical protein ABSH34_02615 [Verrucomicrobiota bacterium]